MKATVDNMQKLKLVTSRACARQIAAVRREIEQSEKAQQGDPESEVAFRSSEFKSDSLERENLRLTQQVHQLEVQLEFLQRKQGKATRAIRGEKSRKRSELFSRGFDPSRFRHSLE
jgi:hypothetical protein